MHNPGGARLPLVADVLGVSENKLYDKVMAEYDAVPESERGPTTMAMIAMRVGKQHVMDGFTAMLVRLRMRQARKDGEL